MTILLYDVAATVGIVVQIIVLYSVSVAAASSWTIIRSLLCMEHSNKVS